MCNRFIVSLQLSTTKGDIMKFLTFLPFCLLINATIANAESANPFFGKWKAEWQSAKKMEESHFTIDDKGGSWRTLSHSRNDPCAGKEVPIQIENSSPEAMTLKLKFSEALPGCTDATVRLKRADDGSVSGKRGKADLVLTKE